MGRGGSAGVLVHQNARQIHPIGRNDFAVVFVLMFDRLDFPTRAMP